MNLVLAFLGFDFIIIVHEFGHFIVAKMADIKVLEFSLFVGPKIFSIKKGETEYSLRLIPILAYVKMEGEEEKSDSERAFNNKSLPVRFAVVAAGPLANLFVAILIISIVFGMTGFVTTQLSYVEEESPGYSANLRVGDKIVKYDGKRVYHPMDIIQFLYVYKGKPAEVEVIRDGQKFTTVIEPLKIPEQEKYLFGFSVEQIAGSLSNVVGAVSPGTPAEAAGLRPGDKIIKLNETPINEKKDIDDFMSTNKGEPVKMTVLRGNDEIVLEITPYRQVIPEQYYVGIEYDIRRGDVFETIGQSAVYTYTIVRHVVYNLVWLISGDVSINQMTGPIGIVSTIGDVVEQGITLKDKLLYLLNITGFLSIAIGATNLIPFPALDGNKLLLFIVEAIRGKPIPQEKEALITFIGFIFLIMLALLSVYNDIEDC